MSTAMTEAGGVVRIEVSAGKAARLFGVPFLLVGLWLGYHLAGGIADLLTGRAPVGEFLAGTVLLAVVTASFLLPGWLLIASRGRVEIDRLQGTVTSIRDLRVYQSRQSRPLSDFTRLEVDLLATAPDRSSSRGRAFQVELAARNSRNVVVGLLDDGDEALSSARRLGALVGLPVEDLRHTEPDDA